MTNQHEKMADFLEWLADAPTGEICYPHQGACAALKGAGFSSLDFLRLAIYWEKYSGFFPTQSPVHNAQ